MAPRQAPSSWLSILRAFSNSALASDILLFGPAPPAWPGVLSTDLPDPAAATAAAVGKPSCCRRTSCEDVATRLPTAAFASLVPAVPPTRLSEEVPVADGAAEAPGDAPGVLLGPEPVRVPVVGAPRLGLCDSLRPSSAIWSEQGPAAAAPGMATAPRQIADKPAMAFNEACIEFLLYGIRPQRPAPPRFPPHRNTRS